jgi:hypothetical protein
MEINRQGKYPNPQIQRQENIKHTVETVKKLKGKVNMQNTIISIMSALCVTRRVARDYVLVALFQLGLDESDFR